MLDTNLSSFTYGTEEVCLFFTQHSHENISLQAWSAAPVFVFCYDIKKNGILRDVVLNATQPTRAQWFWSLGKVLCHGFGSSATLCSENGPYMNRVSCFEVHILPLWGFLKKALDIHFLSKKKKKASVTGKKPSYLFFFKRWIISKRPHKRRKNRPLTFVSEIASNARQKIEPLRCVRMWHLSAHG